METLPQQPHVQILPQIDGTNNANNPLFAGEDFNRIPAEYFIAMTAQDNPMIIEMANYALGNLLPEI